MIQYVVCKRKTELKTNGRFDRDELSYGNVSAMLDEHYNHASDCSPDYEEVFYNLEIALKELKEIYLSAQFGWYGGFEYYTVEEKWLEVRVYDEAYCEFLESQEEFYTHA